MTVIRSKRWKLPLALATLLLVAACSSDSNPALPLEYGDLLFPRQQAVDGERVVMEALLIGTLAASEGCLRIDDRGSETSYLPIWPPGFELSFANGVIDVVDEAGRAWCRWARWSTWAGAKFTHWRALAASTPT